ncbi:MAG: hypothetical protein JXQ67_05525 [Campylobacterales bacterium]|nr:hypothetical protein [Campylobacterales bacterium]
MSSHKNLEKLEAIKEAIQKNDKLSETEKSESVKRIEEWVLEDRAFGTIEQELLKISNYFSELLSELGIK